MATPEYRCPHCRGRAEIRPRSWVTGSRSDLGNLLVCRTEGCDTWVAVHSKTMRPMGRMANRVTRAKRRDAHAALDPLWLLHGYTREQVYGWISVVLGVRHERAHVGWLTDAQLDRITELANQVVSDLQEEGRDA